MHAYHHRAFFSQIEKVTGTQLFAGKTGPDLASTDWSKQECACSNMIYISRPPQLRKKMGNVQEASRRDGKPTVTLLKAASTNKRQSELLSKLKAFLDTRNHASVDDAAIEVLSADKNDARGLRGQACARAAKQLERNHVIGL